MARLPMCIFSFLFGHCYTTALAAVAAVYHEFQFLFIKFEIFYIKQEVIWIIVLIKKKCEIVIYARGSVEVGEEKKSQI